MVMSRNEFRSAVLIRDNSLCVFCGQPAADAHHIMERRLFPDGGYYLDNGASVCESHHLLCEQTIIRTDEVRTAAKIKDIVLPPHLYSDEEYDKWGNIVLPNGTILKGELFFDESVQKALLQGGKLTLFTDMVKYPRTYHVPWSQGITKDDRVHGDMKHFEGQEVVVTVKEDGENTTMYRNGIHARSTDSLHHPSQSWVKNFHSIFSYNIPDGWRVCGENLYAKHSIHYRNLSTYFYGFSIWTERNVCLSWAETMEWFALLEIEPIPILYQGVYDEELIKPLYRQVMNGDECEGYVIRMAGSFTYGDFRRSVAKFVRKNHVANGENHWRAGKQIVPNLIIPADATQGSAKQ
jgi:hypothetical protein